MQTIQSAWLQAAAAAPGALMFGALGQVPGARFKGAGRFFSSSSLVLSLSSVRDGLVAMMI